MAEDASDQLSQLHIAALKGDTAIGDLVGDRIFDFVPRQTPYPYIIYQISSSEEWDTSTEDGEEHSVYLNVWDDKEGAKRVNRIMRRAKELFHDETAFTLTDHNLVNCRRVSKTVDRDGQLYHGVGLFRAITEET